MNRSMFAGVNSPQGFIDYFGNILPSAKAAKRWYLKGPSGCGKSTFMKKLVSEVAGTGKTAELFHCANDAQSLDAVAVVDAGVCVMDATAPHARDPEFPRNLDILLDFSQFLDEKLLHENSSELIHLGHTRKLMYEQAGGYLAALGKIYNADMLSGSSTLNEAKMHELARGWIREIIGEQVNLGRHQVAVNIQGTSDGLAQSKTVDRKLFLSALTPDGRVSFMNNFRNNNIVYGIKSMRGGVGVDRFLSAIKNMAKFYGISIESFHNPLAPERIEALHLFGEALQTSVAIMPVEGIFSYSGVENARIELEACFDVKALDILPHNNDLIETLLKSTTEMLYKAREVHSEIECIYTNALMYTELDEMSSNAIDSIIGHVTQIV